MTETMTVAELRDFLGEFPPTLPVFATWEGVVNPFFKNHFEQGAERLLIDVEFSTEHAAPTRSHDGATTLGTDQITKAALRMFKNSYRADPQ